MRLNYPKSVLEKKIKKYLHYLENIVKIGVQILRDLLCVVHVHHINIVKNLNNKLL
jgi:hypothetical protein